MGSLGGIFSFPSTKLPSRRYFQLTFVVPGVEYDYRALRARTPFGHGWPE
jgi:hypothetical protein